MQHNKLFQQRGIAQLVVLSVMAFLALGLPLTTKLVQQNQENRSQAVMTMETDGGGGGSNSCTKTTYPDSCSGGVLKYCNSSGIKSSTTCKYGCSSTGKICASKPTIDTTSTSKPQTLPKCGSKSGGFCAKSCSNGFYYNKGNSDCGTVSYCCKPKPTTTPKPKTCSYGGNTYAIGKAICQGNKPAECLSTGNWKTFSACPHGCSGNGVCKSKPVTNNNVVDETKISDPEILTVCNIDNKRCNGNNLEICKNQSETQKGFWSLIERCQYGCDSKLFLCKASCGISEFVSNDMSDIPKVNLCRAGTVSEFDSETNNNAWVWNCGGENLVSVNCEAKRKLLKLVLSYTSLILEEGKNKQVIARLDPVDTNEKINWQTSDGSVAKVDSSGLITAIGVGVAKIKASTIKNRSATVNVTVIANTEKCFANGKDYKNDEAYCLSQNGKIQMVCENGKWIEKVCKHGCSDGKCKAGCGISVFYSTGQKDNPSESVLCDLGKPIDYKSEIHFDGSINEWAWKCRGNDLVTVECNARRSIFCDSKGGMCVSNGSECNREYNGSVITGTDDCQKKAMVCCKANTQIKIKKLTVSSPGVMVVGEKKQIQYSVEPNNSTDKILWTSSNSNVVKVDLYSGVLEAVGSGKSEITVTAVGIGKQVISVSVVTNEDDICLNKSRISCLADKKCFWKNSKCELLRNDSSSAICQNYKNGKFCLEGIYYQCENGVIRLLDNNNFDCINKVGCSQKIAGKIKCVGGVLEQCLNKKSWQWVLLSQCVIDCKDNSCVAGFKCNGKWLEQYDKNNRQIGNGIECAKGCKDGKCNEEVVENGVNFGYRCVSVFLGGSWSEKYDLKTKNKIGQGVLCSWGCDKQSGQCNCKDNKAKVWKYSDKVCFNNTEYRCSSGGIFKKIRDCQSCDSNDKCTQTRYDSNSYVSCFEAGGMCVDNYLDCKSGKIIINSNNCTGDNPVCCQKKENSDLSNQVVNLARCEISFTLNGKIRNLPKSDHGYRTCRFNTGGAYEVVCNNGAWETRKCNPSYCKEGYCSYLN